MAVARAKGKLWAKQPTPSPKQQRELVRMHGTRGYSIAEIVSVSRLTVHRVLRRTPAVRIS